MTKVNLGCGEDIKKGWLNVDKYVTDPDVCQMDMIEFMHRMTEGSLSAIMMDHVLEHLPFADEPKILVAIRGKLMVGGMLVIKVPDFEWMCKKFIEAAENDYECWDPQSEDHFFGGGRDIKKRWSSLVANFYGGQDTPGQYHRNAYTTDKLLRLGPIMGLDCIGIDSYLRKGIQCLSATYIQMADDE